MCTMIINGKEVDVTTVFDKSVKYFPQESEGDVLIEKSKTLLSEYFDYFEDRGGLRKMFGTNGVFWDEKGWLISAFKKHKSYNGNYQIVLHDQDMCRHIDHNAISKFFDYVDGWIADNASYASHSTGEIITSEEKGTRYKTFMDKTNELLDEYHEALNNNKDTSKIREEYIKLLNERDKFEIDFADFAPDYEFVQSSMYYIRRFMRTCENTENGFFVDDAFQEYIDNKSNLFGVKFSCHKGNKVTKLILKLAKLINLNKHTDIQDISFINQSGERVTRQKDMGWNYKYAQFCDAVNPITLKGTAVISVNPIDFWTMSFGNSWASCHTIDKNNIRGNANGYSGMYCGGTESYMLDNSSVVFYFLPNDFNGDSPEFEDKVKRCMFYLGEDKLIQSRVYPDGRDGGDKSLAADIRGIMQKIVSELWNVPNYWSVEKGTGACSKVTTSYGPHYRDYLCYNDCNVSYMKRIDGYKNERMVNIGSAIICPSCGETHETEDNIFCDDCNGDSQKCADCGCRIYDEEDIYWVDGEAYCRDCVCYCDYCDEYYRREDTTYIDNRGIDVCPSCLSRYFTWSDYENDYVDNDELVETSEGRICYSDGDGYFECARCGEYHNTELSHELEYEEYCGDCFEEIDVYEDDEN